MGEVGFLDTLESVEVAVGHRFNDKSLVLREEEETSTLTLRLTSLEDHTAVDLWVERLQQDFVVVAILLTEESKDVWGVLSDHDIFIDNELVFKLSLDKFALGHGAGLAETSCGLIAIRYKVDVPFFAVVDFD